MKKSSPILFWLLKGLVSLGLLSFLLSRIELTHLLGALSSARHSYLILALLAYFFGQMISSIRWALLARTLGIENPFKDFLTFYLIGMFFNLFAPSTVGGDAGRVFYLARSGSRGLERGWTGPASQALMSVIMDRAVGMAVMVWIGAAAVTLYPAYALPAVVRYLTVTLALGCLFGWKLLPLLHRVLPGREHAVGKNLLLAVETYRSRWPVLRMAIILSLAIHFIQTWIQIVLGRALGLVIPWSYAFILYPLVAIFSALPVSFNGIGLREGGYLFLLRRIGVGSEKAIAFGLLWFIIVAVDSLVGGAVFILSKSPKPSDMISELKND
jgi:uncharacterized membrane protein YbhN (UPF0104 family)